MKEMHPGIICFFHALSENHHINNDIHSEPQPPISLAPYDHLTAHCRLHLPSANPPNPGWPLLNLLAYPCSVYLIKCPSAFPTCATSSSQLSNRRAVTNIVQGRPSAVGWIKNLPEKLGPRVADLGPLMDFFRYVLSPFSFFVRYI